MPDLPILKPRPRALCADLPEEQKEWFFAEAKQPGGMAAIRRAKAICNSGCPIKDECLELAVRNENNSGHRHGVFGGVTADAREKQFLSRVKAAGLCRKGLHLMAETAIANYGTGPQRCGACKADWEQNRRRPDVDELVDEFVDELIAV